MVWVRIATYFADRALSQVCHVKGSKKAVSRSGRKQQSEDLGEKAHYLSGNICDFPASIFLPCWQPRRLKLTPNWSVLGGIRGLQDVDGVRVEAANQNPGTP